MFLSWAVALAAPDASGLPAEAQAALESYLEAAGSPLAGRAVLQLEAARGEVALVRLSPRDPAAEPALAFLRFGDGGWTVLGVGDAFSAEFYDAHGVPDELQVYGVQSRALQVHPLSPAEFADAAPGYRPVDGEVCAAWAEVLGEELGTSVERLEAPFTDALTGTEGQACRLTATGTGEDFGPFPLVAADLLGRLAEEDWHEDRRYAADGPTGTTVGLRQGEALAVLRVGWELADEALCPDDRPLFDCEIAPADQLYTVRLELAQEVDAGEDTGEDTGEGADAAPHGRTVMNGDAPPAAQRAAEALAERLGVEEEAVSVTSAEYVEWPDACLGLAAAGQMCAQVITPGYRITLEVAGRTYRYHSDESGRTVLPADAMRLEGGLGTEERLP